MNDAGNIAEIELTGDLYITPQPTLGDIGAMEELERALVGLDPTDQEELERAIARTIDTHDIEAPGIEPEHFAQPVLRAAENLEPVEEYRARQ